MSADGSTVLVGAQTASNNGQVYVYHVSSETAWSSLSAPTATLANPGTTVAQFGSSVSLSSDGTTALVGADAVNNGTGVAYVFHVPDESSWSDSTAPIATLANSNEIADSAFGFGATLSHDGTTALIGDVGKGVYVYHSPSDSAWTTTSTPTATLTPGSGSPEFGYSIALSSDGSKALVGVDRLIDSSTDYVAYVFQAPNETSWSNMASASAVLTSPAPSSDETTAVAISSDGLTALVGVASGNSSAGSASVYEVAAAGNWSGSLTPNATLSDAATPDGAFGAAASLSTDGTTAIIGDPGLNTAMGAAYVFNDSPPPPPPPPPPPVTHGYWLVGSDGGIFSFGSAQFYGSMGGVPLQRPIVGIVPTPDRGGYWLDASDGGVFSFGDTQFYGSIPQLGLHPAGSGLANSLSAPIVGMVPSHDDRGYFMVGSDGGVFAFGDATFAGSCPGIGGCVGAAVAVMPDSTGNGYWLVTKSGAIYTFGDAPFLGAPGQQSSPITSAAATPSGKGYWILEGNGQVFAYGDATGLGSPPSGTFNGLNPANAIFGTSDGLGYWVADAVGEVFTFGDAPNDGDMSGTHLNGPVIAASGS